MEDGDRSRYANHIGENGERLYQQAEQLELEGVVAKHVASPYMAGRSREWVKIKTPIGRERD